MPDLGGEQAPVRGRASSTEVFVAVLHSYITPSHPQPAAPFLSFPTIFPSFTLTVMTVFNKLALVAAAVAGMQLVSAQT